MLIILVLSVLMNNIVAAIIGVVIVQVTKLIGFAHVVLHIFVDHGQAVTTNLRVITTVVDVIYWIVPRYLDSDLTREVYAGAQATRGDSALSTINVSGPFDVAYWFAWVAVLFILLTWVLQRREV
jgi:hypothetical protein